MRDSILKIVIVLMLLSGCASFGPKTILRDRFEYTTVLSDSWKDQMLLNIIRLRYGDVPIFLDVSSVINSYELSGRANIGSGMDFSPSFGSGADIDLNGTYANKPTISYTPLSGERFAKSLMTPIPVFSIFSLIQSGYPINLVFRIMLQSVNGIDNRNIGKNYTNPDFQHLVNTLREIQDASAMRLRLSTSEGVDRLMLVFEKPEDQELEAKILETMNILKLNPNQREFNISYGEVQQENSEIVILSRSILKILNELSNYVEVPSSHVADNRVSPSFSEFSADGERIPPLVNIHLSEQKPSDAFVSVPYGNYWFWIDNKDLQTKKIFSFMLFTFTLVETGGRDATPFITVPVR